MYEESAGAEEYVIMATDGWDNVQTFECNSTSDGICNLPPLTCSQNLTFTIKALDKQCSSAPSNPVTMDTGKSIKLKYNNKSIVKDKQNKTEKNKNVFFGIEL